MHQIFCVLLCCLLSNQKIFERSLASVLLFLYSKFLSKEKFSAHKTKLFEKFILSLPTSSFVIQTSSRKRKRGLQGGLYLFPLLLAPKLITNSTIPNSPFPFSFIKGTVLFRQKLFSHYSL